MMSRSALFIVLGTIAMLILACAAPAQFAPRPERVASDGDMPVVVVTASASILVPPDMVRISLSVISEGPEPQDVIRENSKRVSRVLDMLQRKGAAKDELSTSRFSIQPMYSQPKPGERNFSPQIIGYRVNNSITVKSQNLQLAGDLVQAAVDGGANTIDFVSFGLDDERTKRSDVLRQAVENAREDADAAVTASGAQLGRIHRLTINTAGQVYQSRQAQLFGKANATPPPMEPADVVVSASVTIEFEIQQ